MAASANPPSANGGHDGAAGHRAPPSSAAANGNPVNSADNEGCGGGVVSAAAETEAALAHHTGICLDWTADEQSLLEDLLTKYASEPIVRRYCKIATHFSGKTVRDVALFCRWMNNIEHHFHDKAVLCKKKENSKRRKEDYPARKSKDRKEKASDSSVKSSSHLATRPHGPPYAPPMVALDNDDGISYKDIGGAKGELLEQTANILSQISANFSSFQIHDNINLLSKTRDNILTILNDLSDMPEIMKQMPPLPVKVNEELANSILPQSSHQMKA